ncbi:MAG: energy transducer TonB [Planctomycetota bacterium]
MSTAVKPTIGILAIALAALGACRASSPAASATTTVTARPPGTAAQGAPGEPSVGSSDSSRARAIAMARFAAGDQPVYPEMSRRLQEEGIVELKLELLDDGRVQDLGLARSSGHRRLDEAALTAARTWRFNPRTGGGDVEAIRYRVVFKLVD